MINENRALWKYILFTILTCGIYSQYFIYSIAQDVNEMCRDDGKQTGGLAKFIILSILTLGIYTWVWYYKLGNRLYDNAYRFGLRFSENGTSILLWNIFGVLICGIGPFIAMNIVIKKTNAMAHAYNSAAGSPSREPERAEYRVQEVPKQIPQQEPAPEYKEKPGNMGDSAQPKAVCFCNRCGAPMEQSANFCTNCGSPNVYLQRSDTNIEMMEEKQSIPARNEPTVWDPDATAPHPIIEKQEPQTTPPPMPEWTEYKPEPVIMDVRPEQSGIADVLRDPQSRKENPTPAYSAPADTYSSAPTDILRRQPQATLYIVSAGQTVLISQDAFRIGKNAPAVDYQILNNITVSRLHAIIFRRNGSFYIADQNSTNGTYINNVRITTECQLHDGDSIRLSDEEIIFHIRKMSE